MAKQKNPSAETPPPDDQDPSQELNENSVDQLYRMLAENELDDATIRIYRRPPKEAKFQYLAEMSTEDFSLETVKTLYGGGEYTIRLIGGDKKYVASRTFRIDPRIKGTLDAKEAAAVVLPPDRSAEIQSNLMDRLIKMQSDNTSVLLATIMESNKTNTALMVEALRSARQPDQSSGSSLKEFLPLIQLVMEARGGSAMKPNEMLDMLTKMRDFSSGGEGGNMMESIVKALPGLAGMLGKIQPPAPGVQMQPAAAREMKQAQPVEEQAMNSPPAAQDQQLADFGKILDLAILGATKNHDVGLYSDLVWEHMTPIMVQPLENILTADTWFEDLFQTIPEARKAEMAKLKPWFSNMRQQLLQNIHDSKNPKHDDADDSAEPGEGDASRVQHS